MQEKRADEIFYSNFKYLREKNGLKQSELAEVLHVTNQAVSKWEIGKSMPEISTIVEIAKIFNVSTDEILSTDLREKDMVNPQANKQTRMQRNPPLIQGQFENETHSIKIYKFYISGLILFSLIVFAFIPVQFDWITSYALLGLLIMNIICLIGFIRTLLDIKKHYLHNGHLKGLPFCVIANMMIGFWIILFLIMMESSSNRLKPFYILLCIYAFLNSIALSFSNVFYKNAREEN